MVRRRERREVRAPGRAVPDHHRVPEGQDGAEDDTQHRDRPDAPDGRGPPVGGVAGDGSPVGGSPVGGSPVGGSPVGRSPVGGPEAAGIRLAGSSAGGSRP
ncbi:hypothetical protein GCM10015536_59140 [Streptomyces griseomycini]|nr:hypothetical protein GCM10015536_59140 [Streptomyces griseomycini]